MAKRMLAFCLLLLLSPAALGAGFDDQLSIGDQTLYLNGQGPRKKAFITLYDVALYLTEKGSDAEAILDANHPMAVSLVVRSRLATPYRISKAFREGLEKSTGGNTVPIEAQTEQFLESFNNGVDKNDFFKFIYSPDIGTRVYKNGDAGVTIKGVEFKRALFGVWLSDDPIAVKLKAQMLGQ